MRLQVIWTHSAAKEFDDLPAGVRSRVDEAIYELAMLWHGDVKRLQGLRGTEYRLRVGEYRVRFALPDGTSEMVLLHVRPRGSAYKD